MPGLSFVNKKYVFLQKIIEFHGFTLAKPRLIVVTGLLGPTWLWQLVG
jgi:hypothetical protein